MELIDKTKLLSYLADLFLSDAGEKGRITRATGWSDAFEVVERFEGITLEDGLYVVRGKEILKISDGAD